MTEQECITCDSTVQSDGRLLHCRALRPAQAWARLMFVHGYGEHSTRYGEFMRWLGARGVAIRTFDQRGHGRSPGRRGFVTRWKEYLADLTAALQIDARDGEIAKLPLFVMGHSHGGLIAAAAGEQRILETARASGCILSSPYFGTLLPAPLYKRMLGWAGNYLFPSLGVATGLESSMITSDPQMAAEDRVDPLMNQIATPRWYVTMRGAQAAALADAGKFNLPLLCLVGGDDRVADPAAVRQFFQRAASADKSIYVYRSRVHELLREVDRERVFRDVLGWMQARTIAPGPTAGDSGQGQTTVSK